MVEMKSGEVVLSLAAQLASWRAVLVLLRTWATCKPWQRKGFHQYSILLADCLNQTVRELAGGAAATESRKIGKGRRKRRYADVDGPGANPELELGPRGPTLRKQVLKGFDRLDLRRLTAARFKASSSEEFSDFSTVFELYCGAGPPLLESEAMDPAGSPSSIRKVAEGDALLRRLLLLLLSLAGGAFCVLETANKSCTVQYSHLYTLSISKLNLMQT